MHNRGGSNRRGLPPGFSVHPLAYANEAVLPFYILHQPVILLIGYFVVWLDLPIAAEAAGAGPVRAGLGLDELQGAVLEILVVELGDSQTDSHLSSP